MAVERVRGRERPSSVIASFGFSRTTIYKWITAASQPGIGLKALHAKPVTGRPRSLTPRQEQQVFRWVNGNDPRRYGLDFDLWTRRVVADLIDKEIRHPARDESGFRADAVHGKTRSVKGQTPVVERPGQRQSISAASAVNSKRAFWYRVYQGGLTAELFVTLLKKLMRYRSKPVHLAVDGLPAHKTALVRDYVASTNGLLTLHILPGHAPELNPDELVWRHMKRTGVARSPLCRGEKLQEKIESQLAAIKRMPQLVRSFFNAPSVAYITDL